MAGMASVDKIRPRHVARRRANNRRTGREGSVAITTAGTTPITLDNRYAKGTATLRSGAPNPRRKQRRGLTPRRSLGSVERDTQAMRDLFVGLDQPAQILAEAILIHLLQRHLIPQSATIRGELVAQHHFPLE